MGAALRIRDNLSPEQLRALARRERNGRAAARMYAIAHALEGMSRAEAARLAGMERQALRDAVVRYNADGLCGLQDRPKGHPPERLTDAEQATLMAVIFQGPDPDQDGVCLDACRSLPLDAGAPGQEHAPVQPVTGSAPHGPVAPESTTRAPPV